MADRHRQVEKSKDGVPIWDGDSSSYQEYEEMALLWEQSIATHKRYLCAPRLITELTGSARRFTIGRHPEWVSYNGGVRTLLEHLRAQLGLPQMPELTEHLNKFFKNSKRRKGENMNDYITRKSEIYARAQQGMLRVLKSHGKDQRRLCRSINWSPLCRSISWFPRLQFDEQPKLAGLICQNIVYSAFKVVCVETVSAQLVYIERLWH